MSADMNIKLFLASELSKTGILTEAGFSTLSDVKNLIDKKLINVLILDTDTIVVPPLKGLAMTKFGRLSKTGHVTMPFGEQFSAMANRALV